MKLNIKLGEGGPVGPTGPVQIEKSVWYPTLHFEHTEELDIPKEGTMVIKFRKIESSERDRGEQEIYTCTIEAREIVSVESGSVEAPARSHSRDTEDALDNLRSKRMKEPEEEEED